MKVTYLLLQISNLHQAHPPQRPPQCICLCQNLHRFPSAVSMLMSISLLNFWLCCAPSCVYKCTTACDCTVVLLSDRALINDYLLVLKFVLTPSDRPRYQPQDGLWPNHKKSRSFKSIYRCLSRLFPEGFKGALRKFQENIHGVSKKFYVVWNSTICFKIKTQQSAN